MITAQVEDLTARLDEMKPLFPLHWEELGLDKAEAPLDPQYDRYLDLDAAGKVVFVTVREDGALIGYFVGFIGPGLHYKTCQHLHMDIFWVHPDHRGQRGGMLLFSEVEREFRRRGGGRWVVGSKVHFPADWMFERLGFGKIEHVYSKVI